MSTFRLLLVNPSDSTQLIFFLFIEQVHFAKAMWNKCFILWITFENFDSLLEFTPSHLPLTWFSSWSKRLLGSLWGAFMSGELVSGSKNNKTCWILTSGDSEWERKGYPDLTPGENRWYGCATKTDEWDQGIELLSKADTESIHYNTIYSICRDMIVFNQVSVNSSIETSWISCFVSEHFGCHSAKIGAFTSAAILRMGADKIHSLGVDNGYLGSMVKYQGR